MKKDLFIFLLLFGLLGCQTLRQTVTTSQGVVAAAHPLAVKAGTEMLNRGGNAVDAAVATAFTLAVVEPSMSGLGGRLQAIVRLPDGQIVGVDATSQSPLHYDTSIVKPQRYGYSTIGIPGVVAGLCHLLEKHGTLPLETVMAPAIRLAEEGFRLLPGEAARHAEAANELREFTGSRNYFLNSDGQPYPAGEYFFQPALARTLRLVAGGGPDVFYRGEIAERIVADMKANGGLLTMEDLANYEVKSSRIVTGAYRGYDLHGLWLPSYGAIAVEILHILENLPMDRLDDADWAAAVYQAMKLAYADRYRQYDSDGIADKLTAKEYAKELAARIQLERKVPSIGYQPIPAESWAATLGHTTHLSTADPSGMMVALTQSLGPNMGSKVAAPDLGFLYAVSLGPYLGIYEPEQRVSSHISPVLITKGGRPYMAVGAAGGSQIVTAVAQVCSRVIDQQMPLRHALAAPRVYPDRDTIQLETHAGPGWPALVRENLRKKGYFVEEVPEAGSFGRVHAVLYDADRRKWTAAADPDWEGSAGKGKPRQ